MKVYSIYKSTNTVSGKVYVGFDSKWPRRKAAHKRALDKTHFHNAIRKHGWENFEWEVVYQSLDGIHTLAVMEPFFIEQFESFREGYNSTKGGDGTFGRGKRPGGKRDETIYELCHSQHGVFNGTAFDFYQKYEKLDKLDRSEVTKVLKLTRSMHKNWKLISINGLAVRRETKTARDRTIYTFCHADHGLFRGDAYELTKTYLLDRSEITKLLKEKVLSVKGWKLQNQRASKKHNKIPTIFTFRHSDFGVFVGTRNEFLTRYGLQAKSSQLTKIIRGQLKTCKGWKLEVIS